MEANEKISLGTRSDPRRLPLAPQVRPQRVNPATGRKTTVYTFDGVNEGNPLAPLINVHGTLYGKTFGTGYGKEAGSIFSPDPVTGAETMLYSFAAANSGNAPKAGLTFVNGIFYGTTCGYQMPGGGTMFSFDPSTKLLTTLYTHTSILGANPQSALVFRNGALYGTTPQGGSAGRARFSNIA